MPRTRYLVEVIRDEDTVYTSGPPRTVRRDQPIEDLLSSVASMSLDPNTEVRILETNEVDSEV